MFKLLLAVFAGLCLVQGLSAGTTNLVAKADKPTIEDIKHDFDEFIAELKAKLEDALKQVDSAAALVLQEVFDKLKEILEDLENKINADKTVSPACSTKQLSGLSAVEEKSVKHVVKCIKDQYDQAKSIVKSLIETLVDAGRLWVTIQEEIAYCESLLPEKPTIWDEIKHEACKAAQTAYAAVRVEILRRQLERDVNAATDFINNLKKNIAGCKGLIYNEVLYDAVARVC